MEHKLVLGGDEYLPFARSRIKALRATGLKYASQAFDIGGAQVRVRIAGDQEYIEIEGGVALWVLIYCIDWPWEFGANQPRTLTQRSWLYAVPPGQSFKNSTLYHQGVTQVDFDAAYDVFTPTGPAKGGVACGALNVFESDWGTAPQKLQQRIATYNGNALTTEKLHDGNTWRMRTGGQLFDTAVIDQAALSSTRAYANIREISADLGTTYRQVIITDGSRSRVSDVDRNYTNPIVPASLLPVDAGLVTFTDPNTYLATYRPGHENELWRYELMHQSTTDANISGARVLDLRTLPKLAADPELAFIFSRDVGGSFVDGHITNGPGARTLYQTPIYPRRFDVLVRVFVDGANKALARAQTPGLNPPFV